LKSVNNLFGVGLNLSSSSNSSTNWIFR